MQVTSNREQQSLPEDARYMRTNTTAKMGAGLRLSCIATVRLLAPLAR